MVQQVLVAKKSFFLNLLILKFAQFVSVFTNVVFMILNHGKFITTLSTESVLLRQCNHDLKEMRAEVFVDDIDIRCKKLTF